jgi:hypothetical protein
MTIQPTFSEIAPATSSTHRATKKAIAFWRRVMGGILEIQNAKFKMQNANTTLNAKKGVKGRRLHPFWCKHIVFAF